MTYCLGTLCIKHRGLYNNHFTFHKYSMLTQIGVFTALEGTLDSLINLANETLKVFLSLELMSIRKIEAVALKYSIA